jgi:hypothetical protein
MIGLAAASVVTVAASAGGIERTKPRTIRVTAKVERVAPWSLDLKLDDGTNVVVLQDEPKSVTLQSKVEVDIERAPSGVRVHAVYVDEVPLQIFYVKTVRTVIFLPVSRSRMIEYRPRSIAPLQFYHRAGRPIAG